MSFDKISLKVRDYKCFGETPQGFDAIKRFNVIIGQNNTGKTTLLDLLEFFSPHSVNLNSPHRNSDKPQLLLGVRHGHEYIDTRRQVYAEIERRMSLDPNDAAHKHQQRRMESDKALYGEMCYWHYNARNEMSFPIPSDMIAQDNNVLIQALNANFVKVTDECKSFQTVRIAAERNIIPQPVAFNPGNTIELNVGDFKANGNEATKVLAYMLNRSNKPHKLAVKKTLLAELNKICAPRIRYSDIEALQDELTGNFEVHLTETDGTPIPLSKMGSGIKTVILVLMSLHCLPLIAKKPRDKFFYLYEELENNLHPALQRRLFDYLRKIADERGCYFAITTHSHIAIDLLAHDKNVQFLHVLHDGKQAEVISISSYQQNCAIFKDLDVRASDILQANCVVWVEGPSDRVYLKHWIETLAPDLREHDQFTFAFSSGTLLSHLTYTPPTSAPQLVSDKDRIQALRINRNAIVVMDRDKVETPTLKDRVMRVQKEVEDHGGHAWITDGREIENYLPNDLMLETIFHDFPEEDRGSWDKPRDTDNIIDYITEKRERSTKVNKVDIAEAICRAWTKERIESDERLVKRVEAVCQLIRDWNNRPTVHSEN